MRILTLAATVGLLCLPHAGYARDKAAVNPQASPDAAKAEAKLPSPEQSAAMVNPPATRPRLWSGLGTTG